MSNQVEKVVKTYKALASIPALLSAQIINNGSAITSVWSQRNLERSRITKFLRSHVITPDLKTVSDGFIFDVSGESLTALSPSEKFRATIRDVDEKDGRKQYLEIWSQDNLTHTVDLAALDLHGDVYTDVEFGALQWSPDENKLLYVAEKKEPKSEPFYKRQPVKQQQTGDPEPTKGEQHLYRQDWGEQLTNKKQSILVQYDMLSDTFKILEGIPAGLSPAHPVWAPDGSYIVGVALRTHPRKLGLIYCTNRPGAIFTLDFNQNYDELSSEDKAVKWPIFTPDGKTLVWLQRDVMGPHHSCMELVKRDVPLKKKKVAPTVVVNVVQTEATIAGGLKFYGLYNTSFSKRCWASERRLILSTNQKNTINSYIVHIDSGNITELEYASGSQVVLDVYKDIIIVNRRNFFIPDKLAIATIPSKGKEGTIVFDEFTETKKTEYSENYTYNYMDLKHGSTETVDAFSAIYVGPKEGRDKEVPLIIWPHGGPHSAFANNLSLEASLFASCGFGVVLINYRGSVGQGQASVDYLLGKIGQSDVADCILATQQALQQFPWLDPNRVVLVGGSHGGFLVTHLSGQYPEMFKAVVARNPVIDVASMSVISDIPDWCFVECGLSYTQVGQPDAEDLVKMRNASPIQHAHKVKAPTLLQVGSKDLRVPPAQALEYYHRLKANGITVKMNLYDDNHPLGTVPNEMDNLINTVLWIQTYIST